MKRQKNFDVDLTLPLEVRDVTGDNIVNQGGFTIYGNTDEISSATIDLVFGAGAVTLQSASDADGDWDRIVQAGASYITPPTVSLSVTATKGGYKDSDTVSLELTVDVTAPTVSYTVPSSLAYGEAIDSLSPTTSEPIDRHVASSLPTGLTIAQDTGVISGTPTVLTNSKTTSTVTVYDRGGNAGTADIEFPEVDKGNQTLSNFSYDTDTMTFGGTSPTVRPPTVTVPIGSGGSVTYSSDTVTVCSVDSSTGALTTLDTGTCTIRASAAETTNYKPASATFGVTVNAGVQTLTVDAVTGDNTINISEEADGFQIAGTVTGSGVTVAVTIGDNDLPSATSDNDGKWSVDVPGDAGYIDETSVSLSVTATKTGFTSATATRELTVDLTAPTVSYTAPPSLQVGVAITSITPSPSEGIASYSGASLPPGLGIHATTGAISGMPTMANSSTQTATVTATDVAGNDGTATITFPSVAEGTQTLTVDAVTGDNTINISEQAAGFQVTGTVTESGVTVAVTIGDNDLPSATSDNDGKWSVDVPGDADYIDEASVSLSVTATKTGFISQTATRELTVDLTAPMVSYAAPPSLQVGVAITSITPSTSDTDIASYSGASLPPGLGIHATTGAISGMPTKADSSAQTATVTGTDAAGNNGTAPITFPAVAKGDQTLRGFSYDPQSVALGKTLSGDRVTPPSGARTTVSYSAAPAAVCTVVSSSGALTGVGLGTCTITASAEESQDYNAANVTSSVEVTPNADLADLVVSETTSAPNPVEVTLNEPFTPWTTSYTATVAHSVSSVIVTWTVDDLNATATMATNVPVMNDGTVPLRAGAVTTINVAVRKDDYTKTYTIAATRDAAARPKKQTGPEDQTRPEVEITSEATGPVGGAFEVTITFSENVTGFEPSDIQVTNGEVTDFRGSGRRYTAEITPSASAVTVEVGAHAARDAAGNGNRAAAPLTIGTAIAVSYAAESYRAVEGGAAVAVTVTLSPAGDDELAVPIRVTRPETTEVGDYRVEGLEGWDAEAGTGTLTFGAGETERTWGIAANHDRDGDDETVELGFGELPEVVMAGEPSAAIVTLEDKGLVELEVRFAQAAYEVKEGRGVDVELSVSPAADRRVEVPLLVALQGGTTAEDYRGVPASVVFEEGESAGTISVEVLAAEVSDSGEGILLSFGELPEAVVAGDPSSTEVHFVQQRTAEQFSQTLEGMLAVVARSLGESAQRAIEGRFARYRQWSRLGSSGGAMEPRMPGTDEAVSGGAPTSGRSGPVSRGEASGFGGGGAAGAPGGGDSSAEPGTLQAAGRTLPAMEPSGDAAGDPGAPGGSWARGSWAGKSWLRNILLGSLGRLARADQIASGASAGSGIDRSRNGYGETGLRGPGGGNPGSAGYSVMPGRAFQLSGASFEMPLGESTRETSWVPAFWGQGDLQQFDGDLAHLGMNYRGGLNAAHVGLDLYANERMLAGLSFMRSWGELDYTDDGVDGVLESGMNTVHPYVYWQPGDRVSVWGIGGLGRGQVDVTEPGRTHDFGADFRMFAGGVRAALLRRGGNEWSVRADAFTTRLETGALEDIAKVGGEAHRGRLMLEWVHDRALSVGRSLSLQGEAGGRFDRGAADMGAGLETGFRLGYLDANQGLDVAVQGRVLLVHESDYRDWGVGVQASWDPGEKQRGFRASATSSWGRDGGGRTTLWDNADVVMQPAGMGTVGMGARYRMESEVAYAGLKAPGLPGRLTPYSRLRWAEKSRELAWGASWPLPARSQLALPGTFALEGLRRETTMGPSDLALLVRMSIPF